MLKMLVNGIAPNDLTEYWSTIAEHYVLNGTEYNSVADYCGTKFVHSVF